MPKIAINGFGRIGRSVLKIIFDKFPNLEIVAINDLSDTDTLVHLLKYDSVYGIYQNEIKSSGNTLCIKGKRKNSEIGIFSEKDPSSLPWKKLGIDIVLECTGFFRDYKGSRKHIDAGAKSVLISAPSKDSDKINSYILGVNSREFNPKKDVIIDMGSCTTNCLAPIVKSLNGNFGIEKGFMTTVHSYTNDQRLLDLPHSDLRRARAAALNIVPTTTGAAKALERVMPEMKGKIDGISFRVPTPTVSIIDFFCELNKETTKQEINHSLKEDSLKKEFKGILGVEDSLLVSSDYIGNSFSSIVDSSLTMVNGNMVKVVAWYDNEWGYASRLAEMTDLMSNKI